jgi:hypothetical protein
MGEGDNLPGTGRDPEPPSVGFEGDSPDEPVGAPDTGRNDDADPPKAAPSDRQRGRSRSRLARWLRRDD